MNLLRRAIRRARRAWHGQGYGTAHWTREERLEYLEAAVEYLTWQSSRHASLLRHLAAPVVANLPAVRQTNASFDFQWSDISTGAGLLDDPAFRAEAPRLVTQFTALPAEWFRDKHVVDVGCGMGRFSWALCRLGAHVLSVDQSEHGLRHTAESCREFPTHRTRRVDLLKPLELPEVADLVWCFGVLHHTGDTYGAFRNIAPLVKPGGYIYLMIYGEPRRYVIDDYLEINEYEEWRRRTANVDLHAKLTAIRDGMTARAFRKVGEQYVHGYFDAISPAINDLHTFEEVESWLLEAGFEDIKQTVLARNLHIVARRRGRPIER